jgi:hypothetical protein
VGVVPAAPQGRGAGGRRRLIITTISGWLVGVVPAGGKEGRAAKMRTKLANLIGYRLREPAQLNSASSFRLGLIIFFFGLSAAGSQGALALPESYPHPSSFNLIKANKPTH